MTPVNTVAKHKFPVCEACNRFLRVVAQANIV